MSQLASVRRITGYVRESTVNATKRHAGKTVTAYHRPACNIAGSVKVYCAH